MPRHGLSIETLHASGCLLRSRSLRGSLGAGEAPCGDATLEQFVELGVAPPLAFGAEEVDGDAGQGGEGTEEQSCLLAEEGVQKGKDVPILAPHPAYCADNIRGTV